MLLCEPRELLQRALRPALLLVLRAELLAIFQAAVVSRRFPRTRPELLGAPLAVAALLLVLRALAMDQAAVVPGSFPPPRARPELLGATSVVAALLLMLRAEQELLAMDEAAVVPRRFPPPRVSRVPARGCPRVA